MPECVWQAQVRENTSFSAIHNHTNPTLCRTEDGGLQWRKRMVGIMLFIPTVISTYLKTGFKGITANGVLTACRIRMCLLMASRPGQIWCDKKQFFWVFEVALRRPLSATTAVRKVQWLSGLDGRPRTLCRKRKASVTLTRHVAPHRCKINARKIHLIAPILTHREWGPWKRPENYLIFWPEYISCQEKVNEQKQPWPSSIHFFTAQPSFSYT